MSTNLTQVSHVTLCPVTLLSNYSFKRFIHIATTCPMAGINSQLQRGILVITIQYILKRLQSWVKDVASRQLWSTAGKEHSHFVPTFLGLSILLLFLFASHNIDLKQNSKHFWTFFFYKNNSLAFKSVLYHSFVRVKRAGKNKSHQFHCQR